MINLQLESSLSLCLSFWPFLLGEKRRRRNTNHFGQSEEGGGGGGGRWSLIYSEPHTYYIIPSPHPLLLIFIRLAFLYILVFARPPARLLMFTYNIVHMNNVASFNTLAQCIVRLCCCWLLRQCPLSSYWLLLGVWRDVMCCCGLILLATIIKAKNRNPLSRLCKSKMLHTFLVLPKVSSSVRVFFFKINWERNGEKMMTFEDELSSVEKQRFSPLGRAAAAAVVCCYMAAKL